MLWALLLRLSCSHDDCDGGCWGAVCVCSPLSLAQKPRGLPVEIASSFPPGAIIPSFDHFPEFEVRKGLACPHPSPDEYELLMNPISPDVASRCFLNPTLLPAGWSILTPDEGRDELYTEFPVRLFTDHGEGDGPHNLLTTLEVRWVSCC